MKVLLEFSRKNFDSRKNELQLLKNVVQSSGFKLSRDLFTATVKSGKSLPRNVFAELKAAISDSSLVIIEGTHISMSTGFVLSEALGKGKPVLFLKKENESNNQSRFVREIEHKLLKYQTYNSLADLRNKINDFLATAPHIKTRFNFVMDSYHDSFITVKSDEAGISKTEYLMNLIDKEMKQSNY